MPILIIGIGFHGLLLSSIIAFNTQNPFTYIVQKKLEDKFVLQEKEFNIKENSKIILVTDILVTYKTIDEAIELIKNKSACKDDDILNIFSVFQRNIVGCGSDTIKLTYVNDIKKIKDKTLAINSDFDIEVCPKSKEECIFRRNNINLY